MGAKFQRSPEWGQAGGLGAQRSGCGSHCGTSRAAQPGRAAASRAPCSQEPAAEAARAPDTLTRLHLERDPGEWCLQRGAAQATLAPDRTTLEAKGGPSARGHLACERLRQTTAEAEEPRRQGRGCVGSQPGPGPAGCPPGPHLCWWQTRLPWGRAA